MWSKSSAKADRKGPNRAWALAILIGVCFLVGTAAEDEVVLEPCETDDNPCVKERGTCDSTGTGGDVVFTCACLPGYVGDGWLGSDRTGCSDTSYSLAAVLKAETLDMSQDDRADKIRQLLANIAINGEDSTTAQSTELANSAHIVVDSDNTAGISFMTIALLFVTEPEAQTALGKFGDYGGADQFLTDVMAKMDEPPDVSFEKQPAAEAFTFATTANPIPIKASALQIDHISFNPNCLQVGCWQIDFTTPRVVGQNSRTLVLLPQIQDGVGTLPTTGSYPCHRADICCVTSLLDSYHVTQTFYDWTQTNTAFKEECQMPPGPSDALLRASPSDMVVTLEGGLVGNLAPDGGQLATTIVTRSDPTVGGANYRLLLDEQDLLKYVGQHAGGTLALGYSADLVLGAAQISGRGPENDILDTLYTQHSIRLARDSLLTIGAHGTQAATFVSAVEVQLHSVRDALDPPSQAWPAIHMAEVRFSLKGNYQTNIQAAFVASSSVRVGRGETEGIEWRSMCWEAATEDVFGDRMGQYCAPDVELCGKLEFDSSAELSTAYYVPVNAGFLDTTDADANSTLVVEFVVSAYNDDGDLHRTRISVSLPIIGLSSTTWCEGVAMQEALQNVEVNLDFFFADGAGTPDDVPGPEDAGTIETGAADLIHQADRTDINVSMGWSVLSDALLLLHADANDDFYDRASAQSLCPTLVDGVIVHILEFSGQTLAAVQALFDAGTAIVVDNTPGAKSITPTQALLDLCPRDPPAADADNVLSFSCAVSEFTPYTPGDANAIQEGSLLEVPAFGTLMSNSGSFDQETFFSLSEATDAMFGEAAGMIGMMAALSSMAYLTDDRKSKAWLVHAGRKWAGTEVSYQSSAILVRLAMDMDTACTEVPFPFRRRHASQHQQEQQHQHQHAVPGAAAPAPAAGAAAAAAAGRRRTGMGSPADQTPAGLGVLQAKINGRGNPIDVIASSLGVSAELCTVWKVSETVEDACQPPADMMKSFGQRARAFLREGGGNPAQLFNVLSVVVDGGGCGGGARRAEKATATYETIIALADKENGAQHIQDIQRLDTMPGVVGVEGLNVPVFVAAEEEEEGGLSNGVLIGIIAGGAVAVMGMVGVAYMVMRKKGEEGGLDPALRNSLTEELQKMQKMEGGGAAARDLKADLMADDDEEMQTNMGVNDPDKRKDASYGLTGTLGAESPGTEDEDPQSGNKITM